MPSRRRAGRCSAGGASSVGTSSPTGSCSTWARSSWPCSGPASRCATSSRCVSTTRARSTTGWPTSRSTGARRCPSSEWPGPTSGGSTWPPRPTDSTTGAWPSTRCSAWCPSRTGGAACRPPGRGGADPWRQPGGVGPIRRPGRNRPTRSAEGELLAVDPGRTQIDDRGGQPGEGGCCLALGVCHHDGDALVPPGAQRGDQGHLYEERDAELGCELAASPCAEQLVPSAVVAHEPAHVLDDPAHGQLQLAGGIGRALGHPLCGRLGGGDHEDLGFGEVLAEGQGDVTGVRGHVDQQEVGLAPVGIDQEPVSYTQ